MAVATHP